MSALPQEAPRQSRAVRLVSSAPIPIDQAKKYDPLKAKDYVCTPRDFYRYLAPYQDENGQTRTRMMGESQIWFVLMLQEILWGDRRPEPGEDGTRTIKPVLTWTTALTDDQIAERCGCGTKMVRVMVEDAVLRGLVMAQPGKKSGTWHYNLPVENWRNVAPYQALERKPAGRAAAIDTTEPVEAAKPAQEQERTKGDDTETRFPTPPSKSFVFLPGPKKVVVFEQAVRADKVRIHCTGLSAPVEVESKPQDGILDVYLRDASPPLRPAIAPNGKPHPVNRPDTVSVHGALPDPTALIAGADRSQVQAWFEDLYARHITPIVPDSKILTAIADGAGKTTFAQYQEKIEEGKDRIKAPSMLVRFVEDCARQAAAWNKRGRQQAKWDKPWDEDPGGGHVAEWRSSGNNLKMSYFDWLGLMHRQRRDG